MANHKKRRGEGNQGNGAPSSTGKMACDLRTGLPTGGIPVASKLASSTETALVPHEPFEVLLNGGSTNMDSGTIPIKFFMDAEIRAMNPTHVLIIDYNKADRSCGNYFDLGRRELIDLRDNFKPWTFFSSGKHCLYFVLFFVVDKEAEVELNAFCLKRHNGAFVNSVTSDDPCGTNFPSVAIRSCHVEVMVPKELFSQPPKAGFAKLIWRYSNWMFPKKPRDDCQYRERKFIYFVPKLIPGFFYLIAKYLFVNILAAILSPIFGFLIFFFGFRPTPILGSMWSLLTLSWNGRFSNTLYDDNEVRWTKSFYRLWTPGPTKEESTYLPVTLFELALITAPYWYFYVPLPSEGEDFLGDLWGIGLILSIVAGVMTLYKVLARMNNPIGRFIRNFGESSAEESAKREEKNRENERARRAKRMAAEKARAEAWQKFLTDNMAVERRPDHIDLTTDVLPMYQRTKLRASVRVWFWATKRKVCRPFEE